MQKSPISFPEFPEPFWQKSPGCQPLHGWYVREASAPPFDKIPFYFPRSTA